MASDDLQFKSVELYGGAIVVELPEGFEDVRYALCFSSLPDLPSPDHSKTVSWLIWREFRIDCNDLTCHGKAKKTKIE